MPKPYFIFTCDNRLRYYISNVQNFKKKLTVFEKNKNKRKFSPLTLNNFFLARMGSMGTFGILFILVYPWSPQIFSSVGIFVILNVYFDRIITPVTPNIFSCFTIHQGALFFFSLLLSLPSSVLEWHHEEGNVSSEYVQSK